MTEDVTNAPGRSIRWQPGMPVITDEDYAEWQAWRRDRILTQQRERRRSLRRIDYYPSTAAAEVIDGMRTRVAGGDASSIINGIIEAWAADASGIK